MARKCDFGLVAALAAVSLIAVAPPAAAQDRPVVEPVDSAVARALVERGVALFKQGDFRNAKRMFVEALERDPAGPHAAGALTMLRRSNERLGIADRDDGRPAGPPPPPAGGGADKPMDPYGTRGGDVTPPDGDGPLDPYGGGAGNGATGGDDGLDVVDPFEGRGSDEGPLDPYAGAGGGPVDEPIEPTDDGSRRARTELMWMSAGYGFTAGVAIPGSDSDDAFAWGLAGGAAGAGLAYLVANNKPLTVAESQIVNAAIFWGSLELALAGHIFVGNPDDGNEEVDGARSAALGGLVGLGAGALYLRRGGKLDSGDIALANSLGLYGAAAGLFFGAALDPPRDEAYSTNVALGSLGGLVAGVYLADRVDVSRARMLRIDLGAAVGAGAAWALIYPLADEDAQVTGALSLATMAGGAYLAWRMTRGMDARSSETAAAETAHLGPPALLSRDGAGAWRVAAPLVRPIGDPALAGTPPTGLGIDLAAGWW